MQVRQIICCLLIVHRRDWELHATTATHPYFQLFVESTTNFVGHVVFTYLVEHHKNIKLQRSSTATDQIDAEFRQCSVGRTLDKQAPTFLETLPDIRTMTLQYVLSYVWHRP